MDQHADDRRHHEHAERGRLLGLDARASALSGVRRSSVRSQIQTSPAATAPRPKIPSGPWWARDARRDARCRRARRDDVDVGSVRGNHGAAVVPGRRAERRSRQRRPTNVCVALSIFLCARGPTPRARPSALSVGSRSAKA
jgi:hypothetical protein